MPDTVAQLTECLRASARAALGGEPQIAGVSRLSGGASQESWRFQLLRDGHSEALVLRRSPPGRGPGGFATVDLVTEAELIGLAGQAGVPVPEIRWQLAKDDGLGAGYVMTAVEGETLPPKILRDETFAAVRPSLARQCGEIMAHLHGIDTQRLPDGLPTLHAQAQLKQLQGLYDSFRQPRPVLEAAFRWLAENAPTAARTTLVHGDFRNGNLMIGPDRIRALLDWELAHAGDPMEDLGWICVPSWRFGAIDKPVGGFGSREDLFAGYQSVAGHVVDAEQVRYWEIFGILKWGVICLVQAFTHLSGQSRSVELAAIGRRVSEAEIDLLAQLHPRECLAQPRAAASKTSRPSADELSEAVAEYLREIAAPALQGQPHFHARVAANTLDIIGREFRLGPAAARAEHHRLRDLLGEQGELEHLNSQLCAAVRDARLPADDPALIEHLWATTADRVAIDQPRYATYRRLTE